MNNHVITCLTNRDAHEFLSALQDAVDRLKVLAQIQACAGGLSMQNESGKTFECEARLENYTRQIEHALNQPSEWNKR